MIYKKNTPLFLRLISIPRLFLGRKNLKKSDKKIIFILSTGRTGTKFLAEYFNKSPEVYAVHEPKPSRVLRFWTMAYLQGKITDQQMADVLNKFRSSLIKGVRQNVYIESNNFVAGFVTAINKEFSDPTIIHVVRDPRDYVRSAMNKGADNGLKGVANRYLPYAHLPLQKGLDHQILRRTAVYWRATNECLAEAGKKHKNYHLFRFEDLFAPDGKELNRLSEVVGVNNSLNSNDKNKKVNKAHLNVMKGWESWSNEQCKIVDEICGPLMKKYRYGSEPEWKDRLN